MGKQCLVEHDASGHADQRQGKQPGREVQISSLYEEHARHRRNTNQHEEGEQGLLACSVVGDCTQHGGEQGDDNQGDRIDGCQPLRGTTLGNFGAGNLHEVNRKDRHHDRGIHR
jgi:hypothetical protein